MQRLTLTLSMASLAVASLSAQTVVVPPALATTDCCTSGNIWRAGQTVNQAIYDTTSFTTQAITAPMLISTLEWRAGSGVTTTVPVTYPQVEIYLGTSATDYLTPSTTFASNRSGVFTQVYNGPITVTPAVGTTPNTYVILVPLTTTFLYDPMGGQDLLVEIRILANPTPLLGTTMSTGNVPATHLCNSVRNLTSGTATTGSLSGFACVVRFGYTLPPGVATGTPYGAGCYDRFATCYELFPITTFDLSNTSVLMTPSGTGYAVTSGSTNWFTPVAANLGLTDDSVSAAQLLPFTLNYPGGSTTNLYISSNGFIWPQASTVNGCCAGDGALLVAGAARWCPMWNDFNPGAGGSVHFDVDAPNNVAYVTWLAVPEFGGTNVNTLQVAFFASGAVEFRYQTCSALTHVVLTGWSPGGGARNPGSRDISATLPFATATDTFPLSLAGSPRPVIGNTVILTSTNIPLTSAVGATILSFTKHDPGIDLSGIGMPGCRRFVNLDSSQLFIPAGGTGSTSFFIPNNPVYVGAHVYAQSAAFAPGVNPLGVLSSNGWDLLVGLL